jgi:2-polyprenyl-3-methyl-5-hydroxy-6-metoxy-1,4-benzoquinol methylase
VTQYVFDQTWERERGRLRGLESLYDQPTIRFLDSLGIDLGWSCLEVGCGAGGIATWMAERVGPSGRVVATDLDTRFMGAGECDNLEIRSHDILDGPPEAGVFDIAHARAVIEHVADRRSAIDHLVDSVRPGGWVLIEDVHFGGAMAAALARHTVPREHAALVERMYSAAESVFASVGADASFGAQLVDSLGSAGLEQIGGEIHAGIVCGGAEQWTRGTAQQLAEHFVRTGIVSAAEIDEFLRVSDRSSTYYAPPAMVSAWGRRPLT